jgi:hypothetical protein
MLASRARFNNSNMWPLIGSTLRAYDAQRSYNGINTEWKGTNLVILDNGLVNIS